MSCQLPSKRECCKLLHSLADIEVAGLCTYKLEILLDSIKYENIIDRDILEYPGTTSQ
jgi:hypothetical protein